MPDANERSLGRKLVENVVGGVPFGWVTSDRGLELKYNHKVAEGFDRLNSVVVSSLSHNDVDLAQTAAGAQGTIESMRGSLAQAQSRIDALFQGQQMIANVANEITYVLEDIRLILEQSNYVRMSSLEVMKQGVNEQRLFRMIHEEEITTFPEAILQEIMRNEGNRIAVPYTVQLMRKDIHSCMENVGSKNPTKKTILLASEYYQGSLVTLSSNAEEESAFLKTRTEALQKMLKSVLEKFRSENPNNETMRTGKKALRLLMQSEVERGVIYQRHEEQRRNLINQFAELTTRTDDEHLIGVVQEKTSERLEQIVKNQVDESFAFDTSSKESIDMLKDITGIEMQARSSH